jgi:hypothetical protein
VNFAGDTTTVGGDFTPTRPILIDHSTVTFTGTVNRSVT